MRKLLFKFENYTFEKMGSIFYEIWGLSGAIACKSCRSRQELSNESLLAKVGFEIAKNELTQIISNSIRRYETKLCLLLCGVSLLGESSFLVVKLCDFRE